MFRIVIFVFFLLTHVSHGNEFTKEDLEEILHVKRNYLNYYHKDASYLKTFGEP